MHRCLVPRTCFETSPSDVSLSHRIRIIPFRSLSTLSPSSTSIIFFISKSCTVFIACSPSCSLFILLTMPRSTDFVDEQLTASVNNLHVDDQGKMKGVTKSEKGSRTTIRDHQGVCAICLDKIVLQETALIKGCEHAYCVTCILQWASFSEHPKCPQCKHPFEFLNVHRALDGSVHDSMFTESVCLLLTATWFRPLFVEHQDDTYAELEELYLFDDDYENAYESDYQDEDGEEDEVYLNKSSGIHISNLRWGDDGYIQSGRQEAKPVYKSSFQDSGAGSSREPRKKEICKVTIGRRAKRALKREAAVMASTAAASGSAG